jgi:glycosyltransferase involved in cell wall biosynthesis
VEAVKRWGRPLLLISAWADAGLRQEINDGLRPRPEFLELERLHGAELLDWSRLDGGRLRTGMLSLRHAQAALRQLRGHDVVFSDGEHVGIPLALAMRLGRARPHVVIGHWLTRPKKRAFFRILKAHHEMSMIIVHSRSQLEAAVTRLGIPRERLLFVPYCADTIFWRPMDVPEESVIVSAGREHRDYATLDRACADLGQPLMIAAGSLHSPGAACTFPAPGSSAVIKKLDHQSLREWYAKATLVVVPLLPNDFQAGVTTLLEAMAMGKAVVVTATAGQRDIVVHGETGLTVPPGDWEALRDTMRRLLRDPAERHRLGRNARSAVEQQFSLDRYVETLAATLRAAAA